MSKKPLSSDITAFLTQRASKRLGPIGAIEITAHVVGPRPTVNRHLAKLVSNGVVLREGAGPATVYKIAAPTVHALSALASASSTGTARLAVSPQWSETARALRAQLEAPIGTRHPVSYQRQFINAYVQNQSSLLPPDLAENLYASGRTRGQQPASTYARKVLEQLLIDLSWHSSRLEGNPKSLLDTKALFARGRSASDDLDASMLLNHKDAIEFMVDAVPEYGITVPVVRNIQSLLMQDLLENPDSIGAIRTTVVNITNSVYIPTQVPSLLEEMLGLIVEKSRNIKNPVESAFFMWVNMAYLQPFEDGNKRTSRLCANLPLMLTNCAPLSFLDIEQGDYAIAVTAVYERLDVTLAVELFEWTYRRSIDKYKVILEAMGAPDMFRVRHRELLGEAIRQVVADGATLVDACADLALPQLDQQPFEALLRSELTGLQAYNCARYRLSIRLTENWMTKGRPF